MYTEVLFRNRAIIDLDTGEINELNAGDRIQRKSSIDAFNRIKQKQNQTQDWSEVMESFYKGNIDELRKNMTKLDIYEKAFLFSIAPYVGYEDCCLKYPSNGKELKYESLVEITGISRAKLQSVINSLIEKDIIYKGKNSRNNQYFVNPWLFCKGNRINKVLKTMFKNYQIQIFGGTKWKDLKEGNK